MRARACVSVCRWDKKELMPCIWHSKLLYNSFNVQTLICFYGFTIVRVCIVDLVSHGNQSLPYLAPYTHGLKHFWRRNRENAEEGKGMRRRPHFFYFPFIFSNWSNFGHFLDGKWNCYVANWSYSSIVKSLSSRWLDCTYFHVKRTAHNVEIEMFFFSLYSFSFFVLLKCAVYFWHRWNINDPF